MCRPTKLRLPICHSRPSNPASFPPMTPWRWLRSKGLRRGGSRFEAWLPRSSPAECIFGGTRTGPVSPGFCSWRRAYHVSREPSIYIAAQRKRNRFARNPAIRQSVSVIHDQKSQSLWWWVVVRAKGLEPSPLTGPDPKSGRYPFQPVSQDSRASRFLNVYRGCNREVLGG